MKRYTGRLRWTVLFAVIAAAMVVLVPSAIAVHDEAFQLDGDIAAATSTPCLAPSLSTCPAPAVVAPNGSDWDTFFQTGTTTDAAGTAGTPGGVPKAGSLTNGFEKSVFVKDFVSGATGPDISTFGSGGKDIQAIDGGGLANTQNWDCTSTPNVGDKVDLVNTYAVLYHRTGANIIYAGLERSAPQGDANAGFWFLKDNGVGCKPGVNGSNFTGQHRAGDLLVVVAYTGGGAVTGVLGFEWRAVGPGPTFTAAQEAHGCLSSNAIVLTAADCNDTPIFSGVDCKKPVTGGDTACATVNGDPNACPAGSPGSCKPPDFPVTPPWPAEFKTSGGGTTGIMDTPQFLEMGLNLTAFNLDVGCFSKFMPDTRTSASTSATIPDYALGSFNTCSTNTVTTPSATTINAGDSITDTAAVTGSSFFGSPPKPTGNVTFYLCGPAASLTSCNSTANQVGAVKPLSGACNPDVTECATATSDAVTPTVPGRYCFRAEYAGDSNYTGSADGRSNECFSVRAVPTITTQVRNAGNTDVTSSAVAVGTVIHDHASFDTNSANNPIPAGSTATFHLFTNLTCTGASTDQTGVPVTSGSQTGTADSSTFTPTAGRYGYLVDFVSGDTGSVLSKTGTVCEPFTVVDANIQITPATAANPVGSGHTLTGHVNVNDGTGVANAPAGTLITFTIVSGPGSFVGGVSTCTTIGTTGSCTVQITSAATGTTVVNAATDVTVAGLSLHRATGDSNAGDSANAQKNWVDANIGITPATANNALGTNHVLTITVTAIGGTIDAGSHTATASIVSGPGSFVGSPTCTYTGGGATASCTVTITSAVVGTTVVSATSNIPVNTVSISRTTGTVANTASGGTGNANKTWVDANIAITPATATNPLGTNHVLTITVTALGGTIDAGSHTATASIVSGPGSFVGSPTCTYTGGAATASCTVTITSATTGTTVVSATSSIPVNGVSISRTTGTPANTASGGSGNASKAWVDANIAITPATATNPLGTNHVLTITVNALGGTLDSGPHTATASIVSGPGSFVGSPTCTYTGGGATASCTVTITSAVTGTTVVSATSNIPVNGVTITRTTGTAANTASGGSGNASKAWVDANISITPATATNPTGSNHVLTITVNAIGGTIDAGPHTATASIVSGPGSFVGGVNTCTYTGGAATASCTVTITSAATGTTVVSATSNIPVNGVSITRTTGTAANTASGGSGNASKSWVDAYISITPANANNEIGTNHVLTITVTAVGGTIDAGPHTATASIESGPGSFVGSPTCTYTGGGATASCTVTITSAVIGTTVVSATSAIPVNGVTITRTTGTVANTLAGGTANANKTWVDANIAITPATATNPTGTNHVLTITVTALGGTLDAGSHTATASIVSGPGSFVGSPTCTYTGGGATGSCTVTITSAATGTTVVSATSNIPVNGVSVSRTTGTATNTASGGSGNASKSWVDANIGITPATATNSIDTTHVLTITITALGGTIDAGPHTATASIVSGPGSFVGGVNTCTYTGGAATATCTVTITSTSVGTTVVSATSNIPVNGVTITRTTNTAANTASGGTGNASKTWVAGSITIIKNTVGGNGVFNFTATGPSEMPSSFSLTTVAGTKSQTFTGLPQGSYTVTETGPSAAWDFISLSCTTGGSNAGQVASITLPMGGSVTCTYTNGLKPTLKIVKNVTGGSGTFTFDTTGGAVGMDGTSLTPPANGSASAGPTSINIGASSVSEHTPLPAGWVLTDSACTGTTATGSNQVPGGSAFYTQSFTANYGDAIVCTYTDSVQILTTRTQGFWATHTALSDNVWNGTGPLPTGFPVNGSVINPIDSSPAGSPDAYLCGVLITAVPQVEENWLLGGFWSNVSKKSDGKKRTALDQARMQMLQQYFAAVLNVHMFGSGSEALLVAARTAYCGTNAAAIQAQIGILGNFNTSGDNQSFDPGQSATAQLSKSYADIDAWDAPGIPGSSDEE